MPFKDIAVLIAGLGVPVIRLHEKAKEPIDTGWQNRATTDAEQIEKWSEETPNANCGSVAKSDGFLFFESDEPGVIRKYEQETGESFQTFTVQSRPGRFHFYFKQTDLTRKIGSITQAKLKFGTLRQHNAFVVAPGSIHPDSGKPYMIARNVAIIPAPDSFINWLKEKAGVDEENNSTTPAPGVRIGQGGRNSSLAAYAGKLRSTGLESAEIEGVLLRHNVEYCDPPLADSEVKTIAWSIGRYEKGIVGTGITIGGTEAGLVPTPNSAPSSQSRTELRTATPEEIAAAVPREEVAIEYPYWCWNKTLYEEFATLCGEGNLIPKEYFIESVKTIVGAICGHRIMPERMPHQESRFYTILLSAHGGIGKSSATNWAKELFIGTGLLYDLAQDGPGAFINIGSAQGGFASGSGLITNGLNRHARILQNYDEVTSLIEKFSITGSGDSFLDAVNTLFESGYAPGNVIRASKVKEAQLHPVHNSILGCSTFEKWNSAFVKTNSESSGFFQRLNIISSKSDDRVPNLMAPNLVALRDKFVRKIQALEFQTVQVNQTPAAAKMLKDWHKEKKVEWKEHPSDVRGRIEVMIHRNASHIAWMRSENQTPNPDASAVPIIVECDEEVMEKALALAEYQVAVRFSHQPAVGNNEWALVENLIKNKVRERGMITRGDIYREVRADKHGLMALDKAIQNLHSEGIIERTAGTGRGKKSEMLMWVNE